MKEITDENKKKYVSITIGKKIYKLRKSKKLSREQLAEKSNLSTTYIFDLENGKSMPSCLTLIDICNALEVNSSVILDEFLTEKNKKENLPEINLNKFSFLEKQAIINLIKVFQNRK